MALPIPMKAQRRHSTQENDIKEREVILVGGAADWLPELQSLLALEGYSTGWVSQLEAVLSMLAEGPVKALFLAAGPLAASDLLLLQRIRETSPGTAIVVVTKTPTDTDLKRAFEDGATAFLSLPASNDAVRRAIDRSEHRASAEPRP
jgi:DNA-binding NtrC family response regulator